MSSSYQAAKWTLKPANIGRRAVAKGGRFSLSGWRLLATPTGAREPQSGWVLAPRSASHAWHRGWCVEPAYLTRSLARWPEGQAGLSLSLPHGDTPARDRTLTSSGRKRRSSNYKFLSVTQKAKESVCVCFFFSLLLKLVRDLTLARSTSGRSGRRSLTRSDLVLAFLRHALRGYSPLARAGTQTQVFLTKCRKGVPQGLKCVFLVDETSY